MNRLLLSAEALDALRESEALRLFAYPDPASDLAKATRGARWGFAPASEVMATLDADVIRLDGKPWTIGYGMTSHVDGRPVRPGDHCTENQANVWFYVVVARFEDAVGEAIETPINQPMFDALVNLAYNIGAEAFRTSSLLRYLNAGRYIEAQGEFDRWVHAGGRVERGLVLRRNREQAWFNAGLRSAIADQPDLLARFNAYVKESA